MTVKKKSVKQQTTAKFVSKVKSGKLGKIEKTSLRFSRLPAQAESHELALDKTRIYYGMH